MLAGIKEILIITTPHDQAAFQNLLGSGEQFGVNFHYEIQEKPDGIAKAFIIGEKFLAGDACALVLGDNIFYGYGMSGMLEKAASLKDGATVFGYYVKDPERYGVAEIDQAGKVISLEEKPSQPKSNYAVTGLYFYDSNVVEIAKSIKPSARGELEITDVNKAYLKANKLNLQIMGRGMAWLDTGTHESLFDASNFIATIENRQGLKVACLEEIAWRKGFIGVDKLRQAGELMSKNQYGQYLLDLAKRQK